MEIYFVTLFPELFDGFTRGGILQRALKQGVVSVECVNLRDYTDDRHRQVDDYPFGGGAGMVLKPEPFYRAVESIWERSGGRRDNERIVLPSARGKVYNHKKAVELSVMERLIFLSGQYKDIDERVSLGLVTDEICLGDFILSGGEVPAMAVVDSVVRLLPGVLGDFESALGDSFLDGLLAPPAFTRPSTFRDMDVPPVLLSGDHRAIEKWRRDEAERLTRERRPDLWEHYRADTGSPENSDDESFS